LGATKLSGGIRDSLYKRLQIQCGGEHDTGFIEQFEDARFVSECFFSPPSRCNIAKAPDTPNVSVIDRLSL
jgi:hypothetical protein